MRKLPALLTCLIPAFATAHVGEYHIFELRDSELPDLHDGTLADWQTVFSLPTLTEHDFGSLNVGDAAPIGGRDLSVNVYLAWSASHNRIYAAVERFDDVYINVYQEDSTRVWQNDGFEFMIDGDHSGGAYNISDPNCKRVGASDIRDLGPCNPPKQTAQQYLGIAFEPVGGLLQLNYRADEWVTRLPYTDAGGFVQPGSTHRSVVEFFVTPFDSLSFDERNSVPSRLQAGQIVGLQISLPDFDTGPGAYHGFSTLAGRPNTWRDADQFVDLVLVGVEDRPVPSSPTYSIDIDDLILLDQDRNGILDVGEFMEVAFLPPSRRQLTNESVTVSSEHPSFQLLDSSNQLLPVFTLSHAGIGTEDIAVHVEIADGDGQIQRRTVSVPTRSQRLAVDRLEILDTPPDGLGNADGVAQPGETVSLRLIMDELSATDIRLFLEAISDSIAQFGDPDLVFESQDGQLRTSQQPRFLVSSSAVAGDSLTFQLLARTKFSTWAETLAVVVGPGVDSVPPALSGGPHVAYSESGLTVGLPDEAVVDGGTVASVATILDATGAVLARLPMDHGRGLHTITWPAPPGSYDVRLDVTDRSGNTTQSLTVSTVAALPDSGDLVRILGGGQAPGAGLGTHLSLGSANGMTVDAQGRLYVVDALLSRILRWHPTGVVEVIGGQRGVRSFAGDGGPVQDALFHHPHDVALDSDGNLYIADTRNHRIRRVDVDGIITTIAGTGEAGFSGDGGPALSARLNGPSALAVNNRDQLFVADEESGRIRRIDPDGTIHTVAGGGPEWPIRGDQPALETQLERPHGIAMDEKGNLFIAERRDRVRRVSPDGRLLAMTTQSQPDPRGMVVGHDGWLYIAFSGNGQVIRFPTDGTIRRIAPPIDRMLFDVDGEKLFSEAARDAARRPADVALDRSGNLYISSSNKVFVLHRATHEAPTVTAVTDRARLPNRLSLGIAPNPFNASVNITYSVPAPGNVRLDVYNLLGQKVRTLVDDTRPAGRHVARWDGRLHNGWDVASGVYIAVLSTDSHMRSQKLLLLR